MTKHLLKNFHYKPLENYYETKYVSRLISDLLYTIMADALKDSYQLRPIADHEVDELLTEIDNCIQHVEQLISPISLELDKFPNYAEESDFEDDTIYTEERKPIPKIIPKKKKAPFNVEAFAKECNAYVVKQERQEEQENLQH